MLAILQANDNSQTLACAEESVAGNVSPIFSVQEFFKNRAMSGYSFHAQLNSIFSGGYIQFSTSSVDGLDEEVAEG